MLQAVVVCPSPANRSPTGLPELLSRIIEPESPGRLKGSPPSPTISMVSLKLAMIGFVGVP